ncbi:hypothetical protein AMATHDRAFT_6768 [Amanita thiersii Skay4041]|uniref:Uncharacterized protein n=1 Tax=Amanita thiersii Skay4041 TaxID=703135 RepID=A0A2A9NI44_9AGAR|nr:hypothetical protein AMATHDRAFT_6768 [Amanita thiersii Skay4041]
MATIKPLHPPVFLGSEVKIHTPADVPEPTSNIITFGVKLLVSGLDHSSPIAATLHIIRLLNEINTSNPNDHLPDLVVTSPDKTHAIDYCYALQTSSTQGSTPKHL